MYYKSNDCKDIKFPNNCKLVCKQLQHLFTLIARMGLQCQINHDRLILLIHGIIYVYP